MQKTIYFHLHGSTLWIYYINQEEQDIFR